ncbi:DNA/RNA helicase domain-containing protein [Paenibacillus sp. MMO-58]|uniref:DNA/RNA helicase domain-containing protein n=1 Tax=Paenibacillus sp. MMO-58 TaxID=3081290 RepID=UPI003019A651
MDEYLYSPAIYSTKRLLIIDGIPGSGKTTTAIRLHNHLTALGVRVKCLLELEENHPLLPPMEQYNALNTVEGADAFTQQLFNRYAQFVKEQLSKPEDVVIIESVLFQDIVSVAHLQGMDITLLQNFTESLQQLLMPLNPHLIFYHHVDVEGQWRFICGVRGNEWGPVSFQSDEDFVQAGEVWSKSQAFVRDAINIWPVPKLIIENLDYAWTKYDTQIDSFIAETLLGSKVEEP